MKHHSTRKRADFRLVYRRKTADYPLAELVIAGGFTVASVCFYPAREQNAPARDVLLFTRGSLLRGEQHERTCPEG
ncbi:MAG TPA: hypothetical protein VN838_23745, partial [Bradyrhizobium sp.]|nr:hypothetical protein [Bradyrhizobium sp.]